MSSSYLKQIDSDEKAYCLGFYAYINDRHSKFSNNSYELSIDRDDDDSYIIDKVLKNIADIMYDTHGEHLMNNAISFTLNDEKYLIDIKEGISKFNDFTDSQKKAFIRGLYEYNLFELATTDIETDNIIIKRCEFIKENYEDIMNFLKVPYIIINNSVLSPSEENTKDESISIHYGCSTIDFLGMIYDNIDTRIGFKNCNYSNDLPKCQVIRVDEKAIMPSKTHSSDVGYDLSVINKIKDFNSRTALYDTGLKINLDFGYYAEIVPRSSISKTGYILSNNIGIIDNSYRGNLMIALTKIADDAIEIEYPFKCCQLIIRKQVHINMIEVKDMNMDTKRNEGGFGSTN
jgi:deoxyuridine 5'-triphosphate nucleotidohydrolase